MEKTVLFVCSDSLASEIKWYENILSGHGINIVFCHTMEDLCNVISKKYKAIVMGKKLPFTKNTNNSSAIEEILNLLMTNNVKYSVVSEEIPEAKKVLDLINAE